MPLILSTLPGTGPGGGAYDFRMQEHVDYSANGTYSSVRMIKELID